jgi:hypothetical protein
MKVGAFELVSDAAPAQWLLSRLDPFGVDVCSLVPRGFACYARLFHPAFQSEADGRPSTPVTWRQIARANGRTAHPTMQLPHLTTTWDNTHGQPGIFEIAPVEGSLPLGYAQRLVELLGAFTATPDHCWFGSWTGYGAASLAASAGATFELPQREMYLLNGPLAALADSVCHEPFYQTVNLCWPNDKAWCLATDVDLESTYIAASAGCVQALLDDPGLESVACDPTDPIAFSADTINPAPPGQPY